MYAGKLLAPEGSAWACPLPVHLPKDHESPMGMWSPMSQPPSLRAAGVATFAFPAAIQARKAERSRTEPARLTSSCGLSIPPTRTLCCSCVEGGGLSGEEGQGQSEGHEPVGERPGRGRAGEEAGHSHVGVDPGGLEPLLQTPPAVPALRARLEGVAPDLLAQVGGGGEVMRERVAEGPLRAAVLP